VQWYLVRDWNLRTIKNKCFFIFSFCTHIFHMSCQWYQNIKILCWFQIISEKLRLENDNPEEGFSTQKIPKSTEQWFGSTFFQCIFFLDILTGQKSA
jgi:hypothetical protein